MCVVRMCRTYGVLPDARCFALNLTVLRNFGTKEWHSVVDALQSIIHHSTGYTEWMHRECV